MEFQELIKEWCNTESGPYRRPFLPNKNWDKAEVIIVGTNPATPMRNQFESFEQYWNGLTVEPELFNTRYKLEHSGSTSKSTKNANILLSNLEDLNVLVTNIVWYPASKFKGINVLEREFGKQALLELIAHVKPKVIFTHGARAEKFIKKNFIKEHSTLNRYIVPEKQNTEYNETLILSYHHFSGQGLKNGSSFQPHKDLPEFAKIIHSHIKGRNRERKPK